MNEKEKLQKQLEKFERWLSFGSVDIIEKPKFKNKFKRINHRKKLSIPNIHSKAEDGKNEY